MAYQEALRLYGGVTKEMEWFISANGRPPSRENTPGWYFEPGGPYYVPKSQFKSDLLDVLSSFAMPTAPPTVNLRLSKFNMAMIPDDCVVLCIGRRGTGKSSLIKDLLWHKQRFPIGTVVNGNEGATPFYSSFLPSLFIHEEFNPTIIKNLLERQDEIATRIKGATESGVTSIIDRRAFICLDDCFYDNKWISDKYARSLFMNGRHYGLLSILAIQYPMDILPVLCDQVDYVFIFNEVRVSARRRIYEQFANIFPTFELFCQIMDQCTKDYECLVIHNGSKTNRIDDCVFWYKATPRSDFKIGSREHWLRSAEFERIREEGVINCLE